MGRRAGVDASAFHLRPGRCAIEAKILGCKLKAYDERFPKVSRWKVLDNKDAVKILQEQLDQIDGVTHG